jgi:hypothetical protein
MSSMPAHTDTYIHTHTDVLVTRFMQISWALTQISVSANPLLITVLNPNLLQGLGFY